MLNRNSTDWETAFTECHAFWRHDGNPDRPYARLTSGLISDGYFNANKIAENDPRLYGEACVALWNCIGMPTQATRVIGAAVGGIALSQRIAEAGGLKSAYTAKLEDGTHVFERADFAVEETLLMVEDTITTGKTLRQLVGAAHAVCKFPTFTPYVLAICDRSGMTEVEAAGGLLGLRVICLIRPVFKTWFEGKNPYTPDGQERVPPLQPKRKNWAELTRAYA